MRKAIKSSDLEVLSLCSHSVIKDVFDKFEHDFQAANLPEGKYIKPPPSNAKWYKVGQPCYEEKMQELNTNFARCQSQEEAQVNTQAVVDLTQSLGG